MTSPQPFRSDQDLHLAHLFQQALECDGRGALDQAADLYQTVREADPHNFNVLERLALVRARQGKLDEAIRFLPEALDRDLILLLRISISAMSCLRLAVWSRRRRVMRLRSRLSRISPKHTTISATLCRLSGGTKRRRRVMNRRSTLMPDRPEVYNNLAVVLQALGDHEQAIRHCESALARKPDYPEAYNNLGSSLYALNRCEEAVAQYDARSP